MEVALQWNDSIYENVFSFANNIHTPEGGTHLAGFRNALTRVINDYGSAKAACSRRTRPSLTGEDVREGLTAVVSVKLMEPQFEGQTKTKLGNSEMRPLVDRWSARSWHLSGGEPGGGPGRVGQVPVCGSGA